MPVFQPVKWTSAYHADPITKRQRTHQLSVPMPARAVAHFVVDEEDRATIMFVVPKSDETKLFECIARAKRDFAPQDLVVYHGHGCFSPTAGNTPGEGYVPLIFKKNIANSSWTLPVTVKRLDARGKEAPRPEDKMSGNNQRVRVSFELALPANLADLYAAESYDSLLSADYMTVEEIRAAMSDKKMNFSRYVPRPVLNIGTPPVLDEAS